MSPMRHRATRQARACTLHGDGRRGIELGKNRAKLVFARGEGDRLRLAGAARFVATILVVFRSPGAYHLHGVPLYLSGVLRCIMPCNCFRLANGCVFQYRLLRT